jgi:Arc/MetJ-type ribon-helix-helix transcriptional regulator
LSKFFKTPLEKEWPTIQLPSTRMAATERPMGKVEEFRPRDSEKITINLGFVDLGHIDLLVQEGFYSNRTDFIRAAIRNQLDRQNDAVKQSIARRQLDLGMRQYSRKDLEAALRAGETVHIQVLGLAVIAADVSPELARKTIASIHVLGALQATPEVKAALSDRIR